VQEYVPAVPQAVLDVAQVIMPLSARTPDQLKQKARDLLQFLRISSEEGRDIDLAAIAYTLQVGRESLQERLAFVTVSSEELERQLGAYVAGMQDIEGGCQGQVKRNKEMSAPEELRIAVDSFIREGKLVELARLWTTGLKLDWNRLYGETRPGRISLPGYPFARERYWRERTDKAHPELMRSEVSVLHPLLHTNVSDIRRPRYNATFRGNEPFLSDHRVVLDDSGAQAVIPAMVYLEMARAAIENATSPHHRSGRAGVEFYDVVWADPVVVTQGRSICVTLFARGGDELAYEIDSSSDEAEGQIVHCQGRASLAREQTPARIDLAHLESQMRRGPVDPGMHYNTLSALGVHYGPTYQCIKALYAAEGQLLAELRIPDGFARDAAARNEDFVLHPVIMDGALQAASRLISSANPPSLPLALESLRILDACADEMFVWVRRSGDSPKRQTQLDIDICDAQGRVCIQMRGLTFEQEIDAEVTATAGRMKAAQRTQAAGQTHAAAPSQPQGIALSEPQLPMFAGRTAAKPSGISLTTVG
jgi:acyl transferase domain-containing protein